MRVHVLRAVLVPAAFSVCLALHGCAREKKEPSPPQAADATALTSSSNPALRWLLQDGVAIAQKGDDAKLAAFVKDMEIPNHEAWFATTFGPSEGARLAASYEKSLNESEKALHKFFTQFAKGENVWVVESAEQAPTPDEDPRTSGWRFALRDAAKQHGSFLCARAQMTTSPEYETSVFVGCFAFADERFHWLSPFLLCTLSEGGRPVIGALTVSCPGDLPVHSVRPSPPHVGATEAAARLIRRVEPVYPDLARQVRLEGTVTMHAIINKDGAVTQLEVLSGPPLLITSALNAVGRWRYKPLVSNGQPVGMDTTIEVRFTLPK